MKTTMSRALLRFIYTDELPQDGAELEDLSSATPATTMTAMLVYAEMYRCPELKKRCLDFFLVDKTSRRPC
ncbi:hypothetical protein E2562_001785 [Oryza meyeriana var. granulata]|uniref:BPM/SPOP BACK domain-containing protein n=1 Tax=Oryza meyeriana var. granulata TaxID=110450 RepID=A0A6G1CDN7_9ORYZ|nr:hypothetical protein E2562_001785 [Oryza meyeriana var. granulata]